MGSKGGGTSTTTTVQKADPWVGAQPGLQKLYSSAGSWYDQGGKGYFGGNLSAGMNGDLQSAINTTRGLAMGGSPTLGAAQNAANYFASGSEMGSNPYATGKAMQGNPYANGQMLRDDYFANGRAMQEDVTANGGYLDKQNPYLDQMVAAATRPITDQFRNSIAPSLASQFSQAGRMGSNAHETAFGNSAAILARQLGDTSAGIYGNAYESERGRMEQARALQYQLRNQAMGRGQELQAGAIGHGQDLQSAAMNAIRTRQLQAAGLSPALEQARYMGSDKLYNMGLMQQQLAQDAIDREVERYQYDATEPERRLQTYSQIMGSAAPYATQSSTQTAQAPRTSRFAGAAGGALAGFAVGGPIGAAIGGIGGLFA